MNNLAAINSGELSFSDLQNIINQAMFKQNEKLHVEIESLKENNIQLSEKIDIVKSESDNLRELELKRHRTEEHRYGMVSLRDLGQCFNVSIGSKTMGKLLRLSGIALKGQTSTEPKRSMIINGYAKSEMYGDYPTYQYNPEKCIKKIDKWLNEIGVIDEFYAIDDEKKLQDYINNLEKINE